MSKNTLSVKSEVMSALVQQAVSLGNTKPEVVENGEVVLTEDNFAKIGTLVNGFIDAERQLFEGDNKMQVCAVGLASYFGTNPAYAFWVATAKAWQNVYMARNQIANEESAEKAWQRLCKRMSKECGLDKPKAPSADATRMSEKRAKEKAEMLAKTDSALLAEMAEYKAKDDFANARKVQQELDRREKDKQKGVADKVKAERDDVVALLKKCTDLATIRKVKALLAK